MAETTREMVVRLTMDAGGFKKTAETIKSQIKNIDSEIKNMGSSGNTKDLLQEKLNLQTTAVDNLKQAVSQARTQLTNANTEKDKLLAAKRISGLETDLANAEAKAEALRAKLSAANLIKFGTLATNFGRTMRTMGRTMSLYVSAPLAALGGKAYQAALGFESATVSMQKTIDETDTTKYDDIEAAFKEISETSPVSYTELMELAGQAGALGVGADQVVDFVKAVAMLSVTADDLDASTGADALARFLNVTEKGDFSNIENAASAVTALGNNTASTEGEILAMAQRMAATGELAGMATEDILALAAGFTSVGIQAEAGGSAASKLMKRMQLTAEVGDQYNLQAFGKVFDLYDTSEEAMKKMTEDDWKAVQDEFAAMWEAGQADTMVAFFQNLADMDTSGAESVLQMLDEMGITEIRLSNLVGSAASNPDMFTNSLEIARKAYLENIALAEEAEKRYATAESYQATQLNRMENAAADVGENLVDPIQQIMTKVSDLLEKFGELDEGTQNWILGGAAGLAVAGPLMSGLGSVSMGVGKIVTALGTAKEKTGALQGLMSSPTLWGVVAGVGAVSLLVGLISSIESPTEKIINSLSDIKIELDEESYNATMAAIAEVKAQTDSLSGETGEYNRNISVAVKAGYGTDDMYGTALTYEAKYTQQQISDIVGNYEKSIDELNGAIGAETDAAKQAALAARRDDLRAQRDAEVQAAKEAYTQSVSALVNGMMEAQPEAKAALEQAAKDYDLLAYVSSVLNSDAEDQDLSGIFTPEIMERFFADYGDITPDMRHVADLHGKLVETLKSYLQSIDGEDSSIAYTLWQDILGDPLTSDLFDQTQTQGALDGIIELLDFKTAGENAGLDFYEALTPGLADAITNSIPDVEGAMDTMESALTSKAAKIGAAMSAAFSANLNFNVPNVSGSGYGATLNINSMSAADVYKLRKALTDAANRTTRGYGA